MIHMSVDRKSTRQWDARPGDPGRFDISIWTLNDRLEDGALIKDSVARLYIVGPVHGALDDLTTLDRRIARDALARQSDETLVLHAGSYIDKGNHVPELLSILERRLRVETAPVIYLMGAHEWLMLRTLAGDRHAALLWLLSGAESSLDAWQVPVDDWIARLPAAIPGGHLAFLKSLPLSASAGATRFVSATFAKAEARPFGLTGGLGIEWGLLDDGRLTPIGSASELMREVAPPGWQVCDIWSEGALDCVVLDRLR
jgi:hypothetical protein